jgi:hypothetical protein
MLNRSYRSKGNELSFGRIRSVERFETRWLFKQLSSRSLCHSFLSFVVGIPAILAMAGCSTNSAKTNTSLTPLISIAITQAPPASLTVGGTAPVSATVNDDLANAGVNWVATCGSPPNCGSFSPAHTASGATSTFTAPLAVPKGNTVSVTALSATDQSKTFAASVTVISTITGVTITQPPPSSVPSGATVTLAATVTGDPANLGVDWSITCGAVNCTPPGPHSAVGGSLTFVVPSPLQISTIVGSTVTVTALATADHNFSASASFIVSVPISISLTQAPPSTMLTNATATVIAVVSNDLTNSGVTWSVSCASTPCGSVSPSRTASGAPATFTAPPTVPLPSPTPNPVVVITATSAATGAGLASVSTTASVTIVAPITVQITTGVPNNTIVQNASAPLVATVSNDPANAGVDWTVTCGSAPACGSFSPTHTASGSTTTFTAPVAVPAGSTVTITATSTADASKSFTETLTVTAGVPPNSLLMGQFVMLLSAENSLNGPYSFGGVLTGDGAGNITSGTFDLADASGNASPSVPVISPSTYSIAPDGRGQIHLLIDTGVLNGSFGVGGSGALTLSVVFVSPQHALLSETDSFGSATGTLDLQNATDLASFVQGGWVNGTYSLKLSGVEASNPHPGYFLASALTIDFSASSYSYITDQSDNGVITSVSFASVAPNLHALRNPATGELTFAPVNLGLPTHFNFDVWLIDAAHFAVTDWRDSATGTPPVIVTGYLTAQPSSPTISGTFAFATAGATTTAQPQVAGGMFACGSTGILDVTPLGGAAVSNEPISASCAAPSNGRGLIAISGGTTAGINQFAAYPTVDQGLYLVELDGGSAGTSGPSGAGVALQQTLSPPISASAFSGNYASNFLATTSLGLENFAAQIVSDSVSTLSGTADVNSFNATASPIVGTPSSNATLNGSFTVGSDGRFPLTLMITPSTGQPAPQSTTINSACYIVDANTCLLLGLDATAPGTGVLQLQHTGL